MRPAAYRMSIAAAAAVAFVLGRWSAGFDAAAADPTPGNEPTEASAVGDDTMKHLDTFARVLHYVQTTYVEARDPKVLVYGAVQGMLDTLDPHTVFMPPDVYREMKIDTTGEFQGLGVVIEQNEDTGELVVVTPLEESPAARAGVRRGDVVVRVDDTPAEGLTIAAVTQLLRGPVGTTVTLVVRRDEDRGPRDIPFKLTREKVRMTSVDGRVLGRQVGYVRVRSFQDRTVAQLKGTIERLEASIQRELSGLVVDLRDNPGGLFDQGVRMADLFIDKGDIVVTKGRNPNHEDVERAHAAGTRKNLPLSVLINGGTASAAEIVAGALQDHKRAVIVGERSYGKGSVQNIIDLDDGAGLKLTVAHYYTPARRDIHKVGIMPDVPVPAVNPKPGDEQKRLTAAGAEADIPPGDGQLWAAWRVLADPPRPANPPGR